MKRLHYLLELDAVVGATELFIAFLGVGVRAVRHQPGYAWS